MSNSLSSHKSTINHSRFSFFAFCFNVSQQKAQSAGRTFSKTALNQLPDPVAPASQLPVALQAVTARRSPDPGNDHHSRKIPRAMEESSDKETLEAQNCIKRPGP